MKDTETRIICAPIEVRAGEDDKPVIWGYAALFNSDSEDMGFVERIAPGAFTDVLNDDVRALWNHDPNHVLGRSSSGTLRIGEDKNGLWYEVDPPDTSLGRDIVALMKRGDVDQSSFAFTVSVDEWDESGDVPVRTIKKLRRLYDVSPVTYPAYADTTVAVRKLEEFQQAAEARQAETMADIEYRRRLVEIAEHT